ncbi:DUF2285 domain-containing protein [Mesorhizobium sp. WSM4303]|nr:DUF2285 domain-containing protein [Mesorhizobium sp. WSM4306]TRD01187.1 DUF2285 domain-containing protein [Mesorhizobium sp. WSM4303]
MSANERLSPKHIVWTEQASPRVLRATKLAAFAGSSRPAVRLTELSTAHTWTEAEQRHVVWPSTSEKHHILVDTPDGAQSIDAIVLRLDENFETRLDAARRFWRALNDRPPGVPYGSLPQQTKLRHILNLRAHDARRAKAANRRIAEELLSRNPIAARDWRDHHLRHKVRAILRRADRLVMGGYRDLLLYPQSRNRKSDC